uniref:NAD-dependent protein deacetylase sir-2.1 n=1 Tax=Syphacia muris TaxID=451379 RepID=A0A0N5AMT8_9BILA
MVLYADSDADGTMKDSSTANDVTPSPGTSQVTGSDLRHDDGYSIEGSSREADWKPASASIRIVENMANQGASPREMLRKLLPSLTLPDDMSEEDIYRIIHQIVSTDRPRREKLIEYNTFQDAIELFRRSKSILVLTGAGVSVSCGIPDFRSKDGIYARLRVDFPDLPDPTAMFDINYFARNPKPFFEFAREIFPGQFEASISHYFIKRLEMENKLLRNYTQNIDTLEQVAGITKIVQCHGSFSKATCRYCGTQVDGMSLKDDIAAKRIAMCQVCKDPRGILKPDIVFFGEDLSDEFHERMVEDRPEADLLVVMGSSLKVQPVALIPFSVEPNVPQILINRESLSNYTPDIELLGNMDARLPESLTNESETSEDLLQRHSISEVEFKKLLDEPSPKRPRPEEEIASMWQARYVNVESKLPPDAYLFVSPNKSIFPGAEMVYDKDDDVFCQLRQYHRAFSSSSSDSYSESDNIAEVTGRTRSLSLTITPYRTSITVCPIRRTNSCPSGDKTFQCSSRLESLSDASEEQPRRIKEAPN